MKKLSAISYQLSAVGAAIGLACLPGSGSAQASPYVPLDDVAYVYIDALMARGELR